MKDALFFLLETMSDYFVVTYVAFMALQIFMASRKKMVFGFILPAIAFSAMLFLMYGGMPSYRADTPYMIGLMGLFVFLPLTALLLIELPICRSARKKKTQKDNAIE